MMLGRRSLQLGYRLGLAALAATVVFIAGARTAAGDTCGPEIMTMGCMETDVSIQDTCCADVDGSGTLYLADCTRQELLCPTGDSWQTQYGPGYNCQNVGAPCN